MKGPEIPRPKRTARRGTVLAGARVVTFAATALIASGTGYSGCILGTHIVSDDADLRPLTPVSFGVTGPQLPGGVIILDTGVSSQRFDVSFYSESRDILQVHWYVDRARPTCSDTLRNCGTLTQDVVYAEPVPQLSSHPRVVAARTLDFPRENHCYKVDLYISSLFVQGTDVESSRPVRDGDVAFARWYVVRPGAHGEYPTIQDCQREGP